MAAGSVARVLPVEGLAEYGAGLKTVGEAVHLRNHVLSQLAVAASAGHAASGAAMPTFVVVGGGFAGVEALAELQGLADEAVRFYPAPDRAGLRWVLVEATGQIPPELDGRLGRWTLRAAAARRRRAAAHPARLRGGRHSRAGRRDRTGGRHPGMSGRGAAEPARRRGRPASR
jgi:NADH:quinone reductase (non-electrogenic)